MQIADIWLRDMPQQFQGKHNIEVLVKAFSKQMQELDKAFQDINAMTDIDTAAGKNLDYVGTIIPLTRKEAGELAGLNVIEPVMSDERYRQYLRYMLLRNTSDCTYYDIMNAIEILWDVNKAFYEERIERPATIFIRLPEVDIECDDPAKGKPDIMRAGGVGFTYAARYVTVIDQSSLESVNLKKIKLHVRMPVLDCYYFDGSWLFDGSIQMNQKRRYDLRCKITVKSDIYEPEEDISNAAISRSSQNYWLFDGSIRMDGSRLFNSVYREEKL